MVRMTTVRFFTTLALRAGEEIDGSQVPHLPRAATVEFAGESPLTAVWQDSSGARRVAWYGCEPSAVNEAHRERYGEEPFWLVDRRSPSSIDVVECDEHGRTTGRRHWCFDEHGLPATEVETSPTGVLVAEREYECLRNGFVARIRERRPPEMREQKRARLRISIVPELAAEPFPTGGTTSGGAVRLLESLGDNQLQGRTRSVWWSGEAWLPAVSTWTVVSSIREAKAPPALHLDGDSLARLVARDKVHHPHRAAWEPAITAITELAPAGEPLLDVVMRRPLAVDTAIRVALEVGRVALRAHEQGVQLGAIRPELVYVAERGGALHLSGIVHRAPAFLTTTQQGEAFLWPAVFRSDYSSPDDVAGLAQLLWFMTTGDHPFLAPADVTWQDDWTTLRHEARSRQSWRGPAALGPLLERCLFAAKDARPAMASVVTELTSLASAAPAS
jgi:hypothetical protein